MDKRQASVSTFFQIESKLNKEDETEEESEEPDEKVFRLNEELEHKTADENEDNYELNYNDNAQSGFSQEFNRPCGPRGSSAEIGYSDFQGMAHTIQKEIDRGSDSEEVGTGPGQNPDCDQPCVLPCCGNDTVAYQPTDKPSLQQLISNKRNFQPGWYNRFPWLSVCLSRKKVFCLYCHYAAKNTGLYLVKLENKRQHSLSQASKMEESY